MQWVWVFIAVCAFTGQLWVFRCHQELLKIRLALQAIRRTGEGDLK